MTLKHKAWYAVLLIFIAIAFWFGKMVGKSNPARKGNFRMETSRGNMIADPQELYQFISQVRIYYLNLPQWFSLYGESRPSFDFGDFRQGHLIDPRPEADSGGVQGFNQLVKLKKRQGGFLLFHGGMEVEDTLAAFTCSLYMGGFLVGEDTMYVPVKANYESRCAEGLSTVISAKATTLQKESFLKWSLIWDVNVVNAAGHLLENMIVLPCKAYPINSMFYLSFFKELVPDENREFTTADYYHKPTGSSITFELDINQRFPDKKFNCTSWEGPWVDVPVSGVLNNLNP